MLLAELAAYAREHDLRYGWRSRKVQWALDITQPDAPRWDPLNTRVGTPYVRRSGTRPAPRPGCDTVAYLAGPHRGVWLDMMRRYATSESDTRVLAALPALAEVPPPAGAKPGELAALRASGEFIVQAPGVAGFWEQDIVTGLDSGMDGVCVCCGGYARLSRLIPVYLHPAAFGRTGAGDMALAPTGKGSRSGPLVCVGCGLASGAALPVLASDRRHHHVTDSGELVLWWTTGGGAQYPLGYLLMSPGADPMRDAARGRVTMAVLKADSPGRITIRWAETVPVETAAERVQAWRALVAVPSLHRDGARVPSIPTLFRHLGPWNRATGLHGPVRGTAVTEGSLWVAAMSGRRAPAAGLAALAACRRDGQVTDERAALVAAFGPQGTGGGSPGFSA